jgi:signal peptidase II
MTRFECVNAGMTTLTTRFWGKLSALCLAFAALTFILDQALKWWLLAVLGLAQGMRVRVLPVLDLVLAWNRGISYSLFAADGMRWVWILLSLAVAAWLWTWAARTPRPVTAAALGLIIGGALGNALDRLLHGAVFDFALFHWGALEWYVFNVADTAIVAGVALLLYESLKDGKRPG